MPRLSVILPVLGNPAQMEDSLVSVLEHRPSDCEILVVLNRPYADPYDLKGEVCFVQAPEDAGLVELINRGLEASRAPIIHLLSCPMEATEGWCEAALAQLADSAVAAVTPIVCDGEDPAQIVSAGATYLRRGRVRRLAESEDPLDDPRDDILPDPEARIVFLRKKALEAVGGLLPLVGPRLAVVDGVLRLRQAGYHCLLEGQSRLVLRRPMAAVEGSLGQGWSAERFFWRWLPEKGRFRARLRHLLTVAGEWLGNCLRPTASLRLLGRLLGYLSRDSVEPRGAIPWAKSPPVSAAMQHVSGPHFQRAAARKRNEPVGRESQLLR